MASSGSLPKLLLVVAITLLATAVQAQQPAEQHMVFNFKPLRSCGGSAARCLGEGRLERLRQRSKSHTSRAELARLLDEDDDLGVDTTHDMLVYACAGLTAPEPAAGNSSQQHGHLHQRGLTGSQLPTAASTEIASGWQPSTPDTPITQAQALSLHSRPAATRKIVLSFGGCTTTGTAWNAQKGRSIITTRPYDKDGIAGWSAAELSDILAIWRGVAEDFAPWEVDVTTADPGSAYLAANGMRVCIGDSWQTWYGSSAGGVAFVGSFASFRGYYSPAWVFAESLGNSYPKYVWEAVSHEVGHTLGLSHDGQTGATATAYYEGQGSWASIMGVGYYKAVTQWNRGEYKDSNNLEDDIAVISSYISPVAAGTAGSTMATATPLNGSTNTGGTTATARASGIIRRSADADFFFLQPTAVGNLTVQLLPVAPWGAAPRSNLNATVTVLRAQGTALAAASGVGVGPLTLTALAPSLYFVSVRPTGAGDPLTSGYSAYGSIGQYELVVTFAVAAGDTVLLQTSPSPSPFTFIASPSPSPSPTPSSPTPTTVNNFNNPSPSPAPPSPPPPPPSSPSPPPPAVTNPAAMNVSSIVVTSTVNSGRVTCRAVVKVVMSSNGTAVGGVRVGGTWRSVKAASGWPMSIDTYTASRTGTASFTASRTLPATTGNGCSFTVASWSKSRLVQDASAVLGPVLLQW